MTVDTLPALEDRVEALEKSSWMTHNQKSDESGAAITPAMRRARRHVQSTHCFSSQWKWCPPNYYSLELEQRKGILGAHSINQLCKACLFENKNYVAEGNNKGYCADRTNSKYYLVVVQYVESINNKKLANELRALRPAGPTRFDPNYFSDLRLAPEEDSDRLTGFSHNGVSPFGLAESSIPIVVCKSIMNVKPKFIWMGGGHKDLKLGMAVSEFVNAVDAIVLDASEPRAL